MKNSKLAALLFTAILFIAANVAMAQKAGGPWTIPAKYKSMKSTVKAGDASIATVGKDLYMKNCKSCHGAKGLGDGTKSASLKTAIPSFATAKFKGQAVGDVYFQSYVGRDEMPNFEKKITDEADRWALVAYIKSL
ncbi:MAG: c-type cytochrome [Bacteroidales bacterium]|nr:c-type cytochrome [Bacteroidales bacterium]